MSDSLILNKAAILESMGGDEELFVEMARMYIDESTEYRRNLHNAVSANDATTLWQEAHTLKSLLATFADEDGWQLATTIEQEAKNGLIDTQKTQALDTRIQGLAEVLQQELG